MDLKVFRDIIYLSLGDLAPDKRDISMEQLMDLTHVCSMTHFKEKIGLPEEYRPGMPLGRQSVQINRKIELDLDPFKVAMGTKLPALIINSHGIATLPDNCYYPLTFTFRLRGYRADGTVAYTRMRPVDIVNDLEFSERQRNSVTGPSYKYPIAQFLGDSTMQFAPADMGRVDMLYYKYPIKPVYGVDYNSGFPVYVPADSVQLEWDDVNTIDIIYMVLERLGVPIQRQDVLQYAEKVNTAGK